MKNCQKSIIKFGKKSATLSKKNLIINLHTIKSIERESYNGKINTIFHDNKIPKEGSQYVCLLVILTDLVYRKDKDYYPQMFLEEWKYVVKGKMSEFITDDVEVSSDDSNEQNSHEEN